MEKSIRSRSLNILKTEESKEESKKRRFVGDNYVSPKTRERPRNNHLITSFLERRPPVDTSTILTKDISIDNDLYTIKEECTETARFESLIKGMSQISLDIYGISKPIDNIMHLRDDL